MNLNLEVQRKKWANRRRMAWMSFIAILVIGVLSFVFPAAAEQSSGVLGAVVALLGAIVLGYLGFSSWDDVRTQEGAYER
ncbi:hypothetical protein [Marinobacter qingdaonensis]|uniref:Uncharacterized protein n=1 Tax=Marinobacter qingdaonensis TaxID=3108486 RepID=A0ABU5NUQ7_9GAMM|nr:hypothetical protein [Marinobacter sp. ASW11-75]MEA1079534.1 hypothetical protein [Marinobacter sp. ASW11-75]